MKSSFIEKYPLTLISNYVLSDVSSSSELNDFNHTGMGKQHPFINKDRKMDSTREDLRMINKVINYLSKKLL